jgi:hypothetical protein
MKIMIAIISTLTILLLVGCSSYTYTTQATKATTTTEIPLVVTATDSVAIVNIPFKGKLETNMEVTWAITENSLPNGLSFKDGVISGTPIGLGEIGKITVSAKNNSQLVSKTVNIKVIDDVWVNLPEVTVTNFHTGATAEKTIEVHNGESIETEYKSVTTDSTDVPDSQGFISVPITLKQTLYGNYSDVEVKSSIDETLYVSSYDADKNAITISGFQPLIERTISIKYTAEVLFNVVFDNEFSPLKDMVTIEPSRISLKPHETREVLVSLSMPADYEPTAKLYEFYIKVSKASLTQIGAITANLEYKSIWHVNMR